MDKCRIVLNQEDNDSIEEGFQKLKHQYLGWLDTPQLLSFDGSISPFLISKKEGTKIHDLEDLEVPENLMLGKRVECFFEHFIKHFTSYNLAAKNLQIIEDKITIGELDFIVRDSKDELVHIELVHKFFLYDSDLEVESENEKWLGPNRNDKLSSKIAKLQQRQFPLLENDRTQEYLKELGISDVIASQKHCFKLSLFIPAQYSIETFETEHKQCLIGYWYTFSQLELLNMENDKFYIPAKIDWLSKPHDDVHWLEYTLFVKELEIKNSQKKSTLFWVQKKDEFLVNFSVWW